ncbi:MAG: Holliday junction resolvase RuvX [Flavobacteriales bacterium]|jgi:putative Holliday junction resolvase|nr:Holliday junction resolvase RuvX [Flavobacteriales bacterium]
MGKLLGIDYGEKRIGLAETDELQIIAAPMDTISNKEIWDFLKGFLATNSVEKIILGLPTYLNGDHSETTQKVLDFSKKLEKKYPNIPVIHVDESYTSQMAFQTMIDAGASKKKRKNKGLIDKISASIILQNYMNQL